MAGNIMDRLRTFARTRGGPSRGSGGPKGRTGRTRYGGSSFGAASLLGRQGRAAPDRRKTRITSGIKRWGGHTGTGQYYGDRNLEKYAGSMGQSRAQWAAEAQSNRLRHLIRARTGHDPGPTLQKVLGLGRGISRPTSEAYIKGSPGGAGVGRIFNLEFPDLVGSYATGGRRYRPPKRFSFAKVGTRAVGEKVIHSQTPTPSTVRTIEGVKEIDQKLFSKKADKTQLFKSGKKRRTKF